MLLYLEVIPAFIAILGFYWYRKYDEKNFGREIKKWETKNQDKIAKLQNSPTKSKRKQKQELFESKRKSRYKWSIRMIYLSPILGVLITIFAFLL